MSKYQTQPIKMAPYQIQTVSLKELVSGSELIEFLRVEIPYGKAYGRIPFARVLYAFNGIEQKKAVPIDLDKGRSATAVSRTYSRMKSSKRRSEKLPLKFFAMPPRKSLR